MSKIAVAQPIERVRPLAQGPKQLEPFAESFRHMLRLQGAGLIERGRAAERRCKLVEIDQEVIPARIPGGRRRESEHRTRVTGAEQGTAVLVQPARPADDVTAVFMFLVV